MTHRTTPPKYYLPPLPAEIDKAAENVGLGEKEYNKDALQDLINIEAGGELAPLSELRQHAALEAHTQKLHKDDGHWYSPDRRTHLGPTADLTETKAYEQHAANLVHRDQQIQQFASTIDTSGMPGNSPMERSAAAVYLMQQMPQNQGQG